MFVKCNHDGYVITSVKDEKFVRNYLKNKERTAVEQMSTPLPAMAVKIPSIKKVKIELLHKRIQPVTIIEKQIHRK